MHLQECREAFHIGVQNKIFNQGEIGLELMLRAGLRFALTGEKAWKT